MRRRDFLLSAAPLLAATPGARSAFFGPQSDLGRVKIVRVTGFQHSCPRPRLVGKNSHLDVHGTETRDSVLRVATDQGIEGVGFGRTTPEAASQMLGHSLGEYWKPGEGIASPLGRADHALYDLAGKVLNEPIWRLLGGQGEEWVPVYDGSIYFDDLLPEYEARGVARLLEEVEESMKEGHRAFKIKVGRGFKWMEREAGFRRDVEAVRAIRKLAGREVRLGADSNNGFDLETTIRWLDAVGDDLFFVEEMFPEEVEQDLRLKEHIRKRGWKTRVADGESARDPSHFDPYIRSGAIDVLQPDMRAFGFTLEWAVARRIAAKPEIRLGPHNWGSFLGLYMQVQLGRGIPNFFAAEQDPSRSDLFDTSAFEFKEGKMRVPDVPGSGLILREDVYQRKYRDRAWVVG
jgi:L-alanine-DL-glutamate epimerase-like enolase superfamily enzyme